MDGPIPVYRAAGGRTAPPAADTLRAYEAALAVVARLAAAGADALDLLLAREGVAAEALRLYAYFEHRDAAVARYFLEVSHANNPHS